MATPNPLPFQYGIRASMLGLDDAETARLMEDRDRQLEDYLGKTGPGSLWAAVSFQNGWANFGGAFQPVQYRKVGDMTHVRGVMAGGTLGATAFQLPVGFRPPNGTQIPIRCAGGPESGYMNILTDGQCQPIAGAGANNGAVSFYLRFSVTP